MARWTIHTNVSITRRKSYFLVTNPAGETVFRDRHFWPCVQWLDVEGVKSYIIIPSEADRSLITLLTVDN
jgi:hypothetical protein